MKISLKLTLFVAGVVVLFVGLADALIGQTQTLVASYDQLLKTSVNWGSTKSVMTTRMMLKNTATNTG